MRVRVERLWITPLGTTLGFIAALMIAGGSITGLEGVARAGVALVAVLALMHLHARLSLITLARGTAVRREAPSPYEGEVFPVTLVIENSGVMPLIIEVADTPPRGVKPVDEPSFTLLAPPGSQVRVIYKAVSRLGARCFGPVRVRGRDLLGLFEYTASIMAEARCIYVKPSLQAAPQRIVSDHMLRGEGAPRLRHRGVELYQLREYVEGDDAKLIEWKATARSGRLIVKQTLAEAMGRVTIYFLADSRGYMGEWMNTPLEAAARSIARTVRDLLARGHRVSLVVATPGFQGEAHGEGPQSLERFLDLLSRVNPLGGRLDYIPQPETRGYTVIVLAGPEPGEVRGVQGKVRVIDFKEGGKGV